MQTKQRFYTPEEYLALEEKAEYKSEYRDGEIVPMTGGTTNHNEIAGNFYAHIKFGLKGQKYKVYIGDVRLWIPEYRQYTYPDVMVIENKPIYHGKGTTTVTNPILLVEVLSKSTRNYDMGDKFLADRSLPTLTEYILIDPDKFYVIKSTKNPENQWLLSEFNGENAILSLNSVKLELPLAELYDGVNFEEIEE
ncbi:MAG: Uma2 family endonuclease [Gomphosphaeria aponina SAG 52.96 = DSM 107014]|uniref:Uma2 family endonuclease n=1 Tax=Gomphosphaeria aponina SAG 52.96 = DSM 107014 TaxID=1521640 RepID=A0A941GZ00_9CHRO|nr:Uma2 family endonuclease [Gomphosphaeria aponina SAG 52.96 = DSM 107014]